MGEQDGVAGYITGGVDQDILPPGYSTASRSLNYRERLLVLRDWLRAGRKPGLKIVQYRRYVKKRFGIAGTHMPCDVVKQIVTSEVWNRYHKFTIVRNPWDRIESFYHWRTRHHRDPPTFEEFVAAIYANNVDRMQRYNADGFSLIPFYKIRNATVVDSVVRFENLLPDITSVLQRIGIEFDGWLPHNKSGVRPTLGQTLHTRESVEIMREIAKDEIREFGYVPNYDPKAPVSGE